MNTKVVSLRKKKVICKKETIFSIVLLFAQSFPWVQRVYKLAVKIPQNQNASVLHPLQTLSWSWKIILLPSAEQLFSEFICTMLLSTIQCPMDNTKEHSKDISVESIKYGAEQSESLLSLANQKHWMQRRVDKCWNYGACS